MFIEVKWQFSGDYLFQIKLRRPGATNKKEMDVDKMQNKINQFTDMKEKCITKVAVIVKSLLKERRN